jgi:hypothetical protein
LFFGDEEDFEAETKIAPKQLNTKKLAERGLRTPGTGFSQYNGLANWNVLGPVVWIQQLTSVREPVFGLK